MFKIPVLVGERKLEAIIDTAAQVTLISDRVHETLDSIPVIQGITMRTAGRDLRMKGCVIGPVAIKIGSLNIKENLHVAPIEDDMLIGLDFLTKYHAKINIPDSSITLGQEKIAMVTDQSSNPETCIATILVAKTTKIPPNSVARIPCALKGDLNTYVVHCDNTKDLVVPRSVHDSKGPKITVVNLSNHNVKLKKNSCMGTAESVKVVTPVPQMLSEELMKSDASEKIDHNMTQLPDHLTDLYNRSSINLDENQQLELKQLLCEYQDVFSREEFDLGNFTAIEHEINTRDAQPIKQKMRRTPMAFVKEEEAHLKKMIDAGVIQPSNSDWSSAPVLIRKRDGSVRWCVDYRGLNEVTVKDTYPLPLVEDCTDAVAGHVWFSKLDANSAYWQIKIRDSDIKKTAFSTKYGLYEFVRMPFGLCNAPATFMRVINLVLRGLNWNTVLAFIDDIMPMGKTFGSHLQTLRDVFQRFREYQLKLKAKKCILFQKEVEFLGRKVGPEGLEITKENVQTVVNWPKPESTKAVERFLGLVNYHRMFIPNFAHRSRALYEITGKNEYHWGTEQASAFEDLKQALISAPVLGLPNREDPFILDTDASDQAIGASLVQIQNGDPKVIAYASFALTKEQRKYCTTRKELLAVVRFTRLFRHYLLGKPFTLRTDHSSLTWLLRFKDPQGQIARWLEELSQYDMKIEHRAGSKHGNADALSRMPLQGGCDQYLLGSNLQSLPCGGCDYCKRVEKNWGSFTNEVDYAVPLVIPKASVVKSGNFGGISLSRSSMNNLKEQQSKKECSFLFDWLTQKAEPTEGQIFLADAETKYYWINRNCFVLENDLIWRLNPKTDQKQLLIPKPSRDEIIELCHDTPLSGHQGSDRTIGKVKEKFFWYRMSHDIKHYILACPNCSKCKKPTKHAKWEMTCYHSGVPMERVHIDFLGPLPRTAQNNQYILMAVDQFTKWVECIPVPTQTAEETAKAIVNQFFSRFGIPFEILTDRGSNFESALFTELCALLKINKTRTTAYRPSANGQVERYNRTLMDAVRCFVGDKQETWDIFLPQIAGALRSSVCRSTGFTPNKLMLGREVYTPADLIYPGGKKESVTVSEYVKNLDQSMVQAHEQARQTLQSNLEVRKRDYDLRLNSRSYCLGDIVYILDCASKKGSSKKLSPQWIGPCVIVSCISSFLYKVRTKKTQCTVNHDRLKPCHEKTLPTWIQPVLDALNLQSPATSTEQLYCICRKPDDGGLMICCDWCEEWFHVSCINISEEEAYRIKKYKCPNCKK